MAAFNPSPGTAPSADAINWFRAATPYISAHRGRTVVLAVPGRLLSEPALSTLSHDIALLHALGLQLVICFGLREQVEARLDQWQHRSQITAGRRVTDAKALDAILTAVGHSRSELEARLSMGLPNTPMAGTHLPVVSGNFITARPFGIHDGIDHQHTGCVRSVQVAPIKALLDAAQVVVVPPIGYSLTGEIFNIPHGEVARECAVALGADKFVQLLDTLPQNEHGAPIRELSASELEGIAGSAALVDQRPALLDAVQASRRGVARVHLVNAREPDALLRELFTRDGSGTLVTGDTWENLRRASAHDIPGIIELIAPLQADGTLAARSREQLERDLENFRVLDRDGTVLACAALFLDEAEGTDPRDVPAEIACLATHPDYRGAGRADRLLRQLEREARQAGRRRCLILSTRTGHWFIERGYVEASLDALTEQRQRAYSNGRNSRIYVKSLQG